MTNTNSSAIATSDVDLMLAACASRAWFKVVAGRGNAKGLVGVEGRLAWVGVEGNPNAWASSPDRQRVVRVGLIVEGRSGLLFVNARHVASIPQPLTEADRVALEIGLGAIALAR